MSILILRSSAAQDDEASDWQARIGGGGVVWYHNFESRNEVDNFRFVGIGSGGLGTTKDRFGTGSDGTLDWVSSDGFAGGGCLETTIPDGGTSNNDWRRPFSALQAGVNSNGRATDDPAAGGTLTVRAWNALSTGQYDFQHGWYGHSDYTTAEFDGSDFWIQSRVKMSTNRGNPLNSEGKLMYIDGVSSCDQEIVIRSPAGPSCQFDMYTNFGGRNNSFLWEPQDGGAGPYTSKQPGSDYASPPTYWNWPLNEWVTMLVHVIPGRRGNAVSPLSDDVVYGDPSTATTGIQVWVARAGVTSYTKIWDKQNYVWAYDPTPNAWNMLKLSGYMNGANADGGGFYHRETQIIFSKNSIPCPQV